MAIGEGQFYVAPWDEEVRLSPSEVSRLSPEQQFQLIRHWFFQMFEDPGIETPYDSEEGHYNFIWGGPYSAEQEIFNEFVELVDQSVLDDVVVGIESGGTYQWSPSRLNRNFRSTLPESDLDMDQHAEIEGLDVSGGSLTVHVDRSSNTVAKDEEEFFERNKPFGQPNRPPFGERDLIADHEQIDARLARGARPSFGSSYDRAVRQTYEGHAVDLRALLEQPAPPTARHGGIGHNQPPPDIQLDEESREELKVAVETISAELKLERPDVRKVSRAARVLQSIGIWAAKKLDMTVDAFMKSVGSTLGISAAGAVTAVGLLGIDAIIQKTMEIYRLIINWLNAVVLPL
ncbi:hypothetical protein [Thalassospira xiamenensis]|uniref:hypothetical protein n=1 Tax=Thalassospira xiamenensis TaxID=220697 RepID=UPI000DED4CEA|nr:hypothetical protein [Thalassospira xiamenensis]RCK37237.1 hypothetical protein TH24_16810 [Thalassospira xiamenensis]